MRTYSTVRRLVAVTSCKGGVGKSTISANLAFRLASRGHRVGLFDADVHGPSLPTQIPGLTDRIALNNGGGSVAPLEYEGVKLMSFGWFARTWGVVDGEVRGNAAPLVASLLHTTEWGELDYLVIDSPPGTGEVPRAIATRIPVHGALVVTTPSRLASVDVVRGIRMLTRLGVPIWAIVENMSTFTCTGCGAEHHPFGRGHLEQVVAAVEQPGGCPSIRLPIVADERTDSQGVVAANSHIAPHFEALAAMLEVASSCSTGAEAEPVTLPHKSIGGFHDMPHWPTVMATNELYK